MDAPVPFTSATGYIGGRLLRRLEEAGRPVRRFGAESRIRPGNPIDACVLPNCRLRPEYGG